MVQKRIKPLFVVSFIVLSIIFVPGYIKIASLSLKNRFLEREIERLQVENRKLSEEKKRLENDINYVEKVARESMGVTKKGEILVEIEK